MADLIKRGDVLAKIDEFVELNAAHGFPVDVFDIEMIKKMIEKLPAADGAPMDHARWTTEDWNIPVCSRCFLYVSKATYNPEDATPPYCPHCGAKMDIDKEV